MTAWANELPILPTGGIQQSSGKFRNNIIWGHSRGEIIGSGTDFAYNCIKGGFPGEGNISQYPLFNEDYRLQAGSPCIDAGFGDDGVTTPMTDIEGKSRIDDPAIPNTGSGTPDYVDIGAYEYSE